MTLAFNLPTSQACAVHHWGCGRFSVGALIPELLLCIVNFMQIINFTRRLNHVEDIPQQDSAERPSINSLRSLHYKRNAVDFPSGNRTTQS
jgi:hypothetical protein